MATSRMVDAAANPRKPPVVGGVELDGQHILAGANKPLPQDVRTRAARHAVVWGRTPQDPNADHLLDLLGLTHHDAKPDPAPTEQWIQAARHCDTLDQLAAALKRAYQAGYATDFSDESDPVAAAFTGRYRLLIAAHDANAHRPPPPAPRAGRTTA